MPFDWFEQFFGSWEHGRYGGSYFPALDDLKSYITEVPKDERQFRTQSFLYGFDSTGIYKGYLTTRDSTNYWNDYFRNTGLTWSDVRYPTRMYGFGSEGSTAGSVVNFMSRNIGRLYRN